MKLRNQPAFAARMIRHNQQGFTLIEIAIVLTIVGLIIGGIWVAASTVFNNNKSQNFSKDVIQVLENTKATYAGQSGTALASGATTAIAKSAGWFPSDMISGGFLTTPFVSGTPTADRGSVAPAADSNGIANSALLFTFGTTAGDIPTSACGAVATQLNSANNLSALGISAINGVATTATAPATNAAVQAGCNGTRLSVTINIP